MSAGGIFINYRRNDTANQQRRHALFVEALAHRLTQHFGEEMTFIDTSMTSGTRYPDVLRERLRNCDVLLVIVHPEWVADLHERRRGPRTDWVLTEIDVALNKTERGPVVLPVLLEHTEPVRPGDLPDEIRRLADLAPLRLCSDAWEDDFSRLILAIERAVVTSWAPKPEPAHTPVPWRDPSFFLLGLMVVLVAVQLLLDEPLVFSLYLLGLVGAGLVALSLFVAALSLILPRAQQRIERVIDAAPRSSTQRLSARMLAGAVTVAFPWIYALIQFDIPGQSASQKAGWSVFWLAAAFLIILFGAAVAAREMDGVRQWPPPLPSYHGTVRAADVWAAIDALEDRLTSRWRPPLSRVQRDQAGYLVDRCRVAGRALRQSAGLSRGAWVRQHRLAALGYLAVLLATIALCSCTAVFAAVQDVPPRSWLPATLAALVPAMGAPAAEIYYRAKRRENAHLADEIEAALRDRVLCHLPADRLARRAAYPDGRELGHSGARQE